MAIVNNNIGQTLTLGTTSVGTGATWHVGGVEGITAENLMKPLMELDEYIQARGFKDWHGAYAYFSSVAKLNNLFPSELMGADIQKWRDENANRTK